MRLIQKKLSVVAVCLLSFLKRSLQTARRSQALRRITAVFCALAVLVSAASLFFTDLGGSSPLINSASARAADVAGESISDGGDSSDGFRQLSFELHPEGEEAQKAVTLNGIMPAGASAEAVDVTGDYSDIESIYPEKEASSEDAKSASVLCAYNITITDGEAEYQPDESRPIYVEIADPGISAEKTTELWHIKDDGSREKISEFSVEDGKISFNASAFSVYAIVSVEEPFLADMAVTVDELTSERALAAGFYLFYGNYIYFQNTMTSTDCLKETATPKDAALFYFEADGGYHKIFTYVNGAKKYIHTKSGNNIELSDSADLMEITQAPNRSTFYIKKKGETRYIQHSNGGGGIRYYTANDNATNSRIKAVYGDSLIPPDDYYHLDGKSYGLMHYTSGTSGQAFMADEENNALSMMSLVVRSESAGRELFVALDSDITIWTFHYVSDTSYKISTEVNGETKYLNIGSTLSLVGEAQASLISVTSDTSNRLLFLASNKSPCLEGDSFVAKDTVTSDLNQWLHIVELSGVSGEDYVTYSSDKVSVSDVPDGATVIVYTRIWNDLIKAYEFYAIDHDGTLYPCYERGDNIMWVGSQVNSLFWEFTEYHYSDGTPNYYYELYNPYSRKYLAPQLTNGQTLSDSTIGLNMPGRREGEYYTDIVAWDDRYYSYAGLTADIDNFEISAGPRSEARTFYFASVESLVPTLTKVDTIDNNDFGIKMKMIDFPVQPDPVTEEYFQNDFLGTDTESHAYATKGLLSTNLNEYGYPVATNGRPLSELYDGANTVNHLFLQSTYSASGYFEFDSCQNFATLVQEDGTRGNDFIVYKELGTTDIQYKTTLSHGQFFPYDSIQAGVYSVKNPENIYSALAIPGYEGVGELPESDPRKYEKLHTVGSNPNYYNGMEMDADFVQTPSGKDAWGHDIIFEFTGDDDFWLYVDGELVIDLGGIHSALAGSVNFATGDVIVEGGRTDLRTLFRSNYVTRNPGASSEEIDAYLDQFFENGESIFKDYSSHSMKIFYMERGAGASNLHMRFNLSYVTPGHVTLTKNVTGTDDIDFNLVEYPYQIWYKDEEFGDPHLLRSDDQLISVTYQNSTQRVSYVPVYTPPNASVSYESVYFLNPGMAAEIHFPANTIEYKIIECGINREVYDTVRVNGEEIEGASIGNTNRNYFDSGWVRVSDRTLVEFENHVDPEALRTLSFQKRLYDESGRELTAEDDSTTFSFRLYLSNGVDDTLKLADMYKYYVKNADGYLCAWDSEHQCFVPTQKTEHKTLSADEKEQLSFDTSMNGSISKIPAGYTVEVPNLPVGIKFRVEERDSEIPIGYKLVSYERESGTYQIEDGDTLNSGWIRANESPKMYINNKRGWGLKVNKIWSDSTSVSSHGSVYVGVYLGDELLEGSVKQIKGSDSSVQYFFDDMREGKTFEDYSVYEVELLNPVFDFAGNLVSYDSVKKRLGSGERTTVNATSVSTGNESPYYYSVTYEKGTARATAENFSEAGNIRTDSITNTRTGGVVITLYDMYTREPLPNGTFALYQGETRLGTYTSDENGRVTIIYDFERNLDYSLTETLPPDSYIGLPNTAVFSIANDDSVTIGGNDSIWENGYKSQTENDDFIAYIDVYNKPFELRVLKTDSDTGEAVSGAHFALYRSVIGVIGEMRDVRALPGYEDLETGGDGVIPGIDNTLEPGKYYLTETRAPLNYIGLDSDLIFTISQTGGVTVESEGHGSFLSEDISNKNIYTLTVPNTLDQTSAVLTVTKTVEGAFSNKAREFTFTLTVDGAQPSDEYAWLKNGEAQSSALHSGSEFTLSHGDEVQLVLPKAADITITEANGEYTAQFKLNDGALEAVNTKTFTLEEDSELEVTNTLDGIIPTGVYLRLDFAALISAGLLAFVIVNIKRKKNSGE